MSEGGFIEGGKDWGCYFFLCIRFLCWIVLYQKESKEKRMELLVVCSTCDDTRMT